MHLKKLNMWWIMICLTDLTAYVLFINVFKYLVKEILRGFFII